jgi:hypothetical protein
MRYDFKLRAGRGGRADKWSALLLQQLAPEHRVAVTPVRGRAAVARRPAALAALARRAPPPPRAAAARRSLARAREPHLHELDAFAADAQQQPCLQPAIDLDAHALRARLCHVALERRAQLRAERPQRRARSRARSSC